MSGSDYLEVTATGSILIDKENKEKLFEHLDGLEAENEKLRAAVAKAIKVQAYLCADKDKPWCDRECALHRADTDDCEACDLIDLAAELRIEVD